MTSQDAAEIDSAKYVSFVSFRRTGEAVATPVWVANFEGSYGFTIESTSGKAKRLSHTSAATVQPCDSRGKITTGSGIYKCNAVVVSGERAERVRDAIADKYGLTYRLFSVYIWFAARFGKYKNEVETAVVFTLEGN